MNVRPAFPDLGTAFDGSGGDSPPVETRADWTATLQTHDSCIGRGSFTDGNCSGYGDSCLSCDGIRDADYAQHAHGVPWTAANYGSDGPARQPRRDHRLAARGPAVLLVDAVPG